MVRAARSLLAAATRQPSQQQKLRPQNKSRNNRCSSVSLLLLQDGNCLQRLCAFVLRCLCGVRPSYRERLIHFSGHTIPKHFSEFQFVRLCTRTRLFVVLSHLFPASMPASVCVGVLAPCPLPWLFVSVPFRVFLCLFCEEGSL